MLVRELDSIYAGRARFSMLDLYRNPERDARLYYYYKILNSWLYFRYSFRYSF